MATSSQICTQPWTHACGRASVSSTNVGAGCGCRPIGPFIMTPPPVPRHSVWPTDQLHACGDLFWPSARSYVRVADDPPGAVATHCGFYGELLARGPGRKQAFRLPSPALIALSPMDIGDSDRFVERSCGPNCWNLRAPRRASRSHCVTSRVRPRLLYCFSSKFMPDPVAWHAERLRRG